MTVTKKRRSPVLKETARRQPNLALTIARMMDAIDLGDVWVVRRAADRRGRRVVGARPPRARQRFVGLSAKTREAAAKIAKFVGGENDGTGRVSFSRSKRLPGVEGYAECFGDEVSLSLSGLAADTVAVMLEALIFLKRAKR